MKAFREITPLTEDDVFVILDSVNNGFDYPLHHHPEYELTLITGSSGNRIIGDSIEKYVESDLVLVGPYLVHKWDGDDKKKGDERPCQVLTLQFGMHDFDHLFFSKTAFYRIKHLLEGSKRGVHFNNQTILLKAKQLMLQMTQTRDMESVILFFQLLDELSKVENIRYLTSEGFSHHSLPNYNSRLKIVNEYILRHFSNAALRISEVAQQINLTKSAFSHFFKKSTNRSFTDFLLDIRLGFASKLLIDTDKLVGNIAFESGFNNIANFNRSFKKHFGCTPRAFRKVYQKKIIFDATTQLTPGQFLSAEKIKEKYIPPKEYSTHLVHQ
jgi:AraC-like DNA-binding protein